MTTPSHSYLAALAANVAHGDATEHTHRPAFKAFIEALAKDITATNEPKAVQGGAPDFSVIRGAAKLGIVETKDVGSDLDEIERSEQLTRYRKAFPNLVLTDYLEFRWYVDGKLRLKASLGKREKKKLEIDPQSAPEVEALLRAFLNEETPQPETPEGLARRMADIAVLIRSLIEGSLARGEKGKLHEQLEGFREVLLHDLTEPQFADMYAQTICYGLFAARIFMEGKADTRKFSRVTAQEYLPKTNPFLRKVFSEIAGADLEDGVRWAVDDVAEVLRRAKMSRVLEDFGRRTRQEDPVVHFYETFLSAYDPKMREARGVYYTPEPVVSFIVRSIDHILKTDFGLKDGLADNSKVTLKNEQGEETESHRVLILDPATGTGTFLHGVVDEVHAQVTGKYGAGVWPQYVREHLLPRLFGFELLMAPYAVAHMKLGIQLADMKYEFQPGERIRVFLTNTLDEATTPTRRLPFADEIAKEARAASSIKRDLPIKVILGNPPYQGHSLNAGPWITDLIEDYKKIRGKKIRLGQSKWLQNDYVKFIRFAQWRIQRTGRGILGFITDHSYVDSGTFVGMRAALRDAFDDIYIVDLQGNQKRNLNRPDRDVNVFDITQGVAIILAVRVGPGKPAGRVHVVDPVRGSRESKYRMLASKSVKDLHWEKAKAEQPYYLFASSSASHLSEYSPLPSIVDVMPGSYQRAESKRIGTGFVSTHDDFAIAFTKQETVEKIRKFVRTGSETEARQLFTLCSQDQWNYEDAKSSLSSSNWQRSIAPVTYRPFDERYTCWDKHVCVHRRLEVHQHAAIDNLLLCIGQAGNVIGSEEWALAFVSRKFVDFNAFYRGGAAVLPLYLVTSEKASCNLFDHSNGRRPNLSAAIVESLEKRLRVLKFIPDGEGDLKKTFGPEDVFHYMYAVLHAPGYRSRYAEFLKIDFPRLPLTSNLKLFRGLCGLGAELVGLHLMEKDGPRKAMPRFPVSGDNIVEKVAYVEPSGEPGRVWINGKQYFEPVPPEVWNFHIGGYQVAEKWLKDRKGRLLTFEEYQTYCRVIAALSETMRLMGEIDKQIDQNGGWPIR